MVVRYCIRFTGDRFTAEDLAQQALLEAWLKSTQLSQDAVRASWLIGMARNVCLRWARHQGITVGRLVSASEPLGGAAEQRADDFNLEQELEHDDLARLLERALSLLPAETRDILVKTYLEDVPQREVAAWLGLSEGAVEARLARGKRALRHLLSTTLREEAISWGLLAGSDTAWQETRIWCPDCGQHRLLGRFAADRDLHLDCPDCRGQGRSMQVRGWVTALLGEGSTPAEVLMGVRGYKPALNRIVARLAAFYDGGIAGRTARCRWCGHQAPLRTGPEDVWGDHDIQTACAHCGGVSGISSLSAVASFVPAVRAFQREHRRIRTLACRHMETEGVSAVVVPFHSATGSATVEVVVARDTLRLIGVH